MTEITGITLTKTPVKPLGRGTFLTFITILTVVDSSPPCAPPSSQPLGESGLNPAGRNTIKSDKTSRNGQKRTELTKVNLTARDLNQWDSPKEWLNDAQHYQHSSPNNRHHSSPRYSGILPKNGDRTRRVMDLENMKNGG